MPLFTPDTPLVGYLTVTKLSPERYVFLLTSVFCFVRQHHASLGLVFSHGPPRPVKGGGCNGPALTYSPRAA